MACNSVCSVQSNLIRTDCLLEKNVYCVLIKYQRCNFSYLVYVIVNGGSTHGQVRVSGQIYGLCLKFGWYDCH